MDLTNSLFWQSLTFTSIAVFLTVLSTWWLFFSPLPKDQSPTQKPSPRLAGALAFMLGLSAVQLVSGAFWDASMHIQTGEIPAGSDFLWPPHLMIYSAFLLSFVVAGVTIGSVALSGWNNGQRDPRRWVRRNPHLGAVAVASMYALLSIPGDALWHALYGIDLTAWSPPHLILGVMSCTVQVSALGLLVQTRPAGGRTSWNDIAILILLSLMLNVAYMIGVIEWELPGARNPLVDARPIWWYPLVGATLAFFTLLLAKRLVTLRWAATITILAFYALRLAVTIGLQLTGNVVPFLPVSFLLSAILMDLVAMRRPAAHASAESFAGGLALAAAFVAGYAVMGLPLLLSRIDLPAFTTADVVFAIAAPLAASLLVVPVARWVTARLAGEPA